MKRNIQIKPLDPVMIRDGRPFGKTPGIRAHSLNSVTPGTLAGTLRTLLGKLETGNGQRVKDSYTKLAENIEVLGPILMRDDRLFFPMPLDLDIYELTDDESEKNKIHMSVRRPRQPSDEAVKTEGFLGTGKIGLHEDILWPVSMPRGAWKSLRKVPAYISADWMIRWLCGDISQEEWERELQQWADFENKSGNSHPHFMDVLEKEIRDHTEIDDSSGTARDKKLFSTEAIVFPPEVSMIAQMKISDEFDIPGSIQTIHPIGGERRLASFEEMSGEALVNRIWQCPESVIEAVNKAVDNASDKNKIYLRMVLTTPAYFSKGWLPGWLNEQLKSSFDRFPNMELQLRWACVPRWEGISGWSYRHQEPKAVRRMVPAGSVYFFEVINGDPVEFVKEKWLMPMSDFDRRKGSFDQSDGCGMAVWGIWSPDSESIKEVQHGK